MAEPGIVESQPEITPIPDASEQVTLYLFGIDALKGGPAEFPNQLNLGRFENYMRELHEDRQTVSQEVAPGIPTAGIGPMNIEGEGEVAKTIYYDLETDSIRVTDTVRGGLNSVRSSFVDAYKLGAFPIIEMHTHPEASLPSNVDYQFMLLGNSEAKIRGIRGIAVLCPEFQLFALATDQTPILDPEGLHQLLTQWDEPSRQYEVEGGKYLQTLENRWNRVFNFMMESYTRSQEKRGERFKRDMQRIVEGLEPEEEEAEDENTFAKTLERTNKVGPKAFGKYATYLKRTFTRVQLQFARNMGIKLYMSTDFKNFVAIPDDFSL